MSDTAMLSDAPAFVPSASTTELNGSPSMDANGSASPPLIEQAKQQAHRVVEQTQQKAGEVMEQARDKTKSWVEQQLGATAENLDGVAQAVRQTSQSLREQGREPLRNYADFVDGTSDAIAKASGYLRDTNMEQMVSEVERFARRQPTLFIGIAATLGFFAVRFLKSSSRTGSYGQAAYNPDRRLPVVMNTQDTGVSTDYGTTGNTV